MSQETEKRVAFYNLNEDEIELLTTLLKELNEDQIGQVIICQMLGIDPVATFDAVLAYPEENKQKNRDMKNQGIVILTDLAVRAMNNILFTKNSNFAETERIVLISELTKILLTATQKKELIAREGLNNNQLCEICEEVSDRILEIQAEMSTGLSLDDLEDSVLIAPYFARLLRLTKQLLELGNALLKKQDIGPIIGFEIWIEDQKNERPFYKFDSSGQLVQADVVDTQISQTSEQMLARRILELIKQGKKLNEEYFQKIFVGPVYFNQDNY